MLPPLDTPPAATTVLDIQHEVFPEFFSRAELAYRRRVYGWTVRKSRIVITISEHARQGLVERLHLDPSRVRAIHLAVDHERFTPGAGSVAGEPVPALPRERAGSTRTTSGCSTAYAEVRRERPDLRLVLTGAGHDRLTLPDGAESRGHVTLDELVDLYRSAAALVYPSLYEGFGIPCVEAMACGCPVAASDVASIPEVCGDAAVYFDPFDPESIAEGIRAVLDRPPSGGIERAARLHLGRVRPRATTRSTRSWRRPSDREPLEVGVDEQPDEPLEVDRRRPAQSRLRLRGVADEVVQLGSAAAQRLVDVDVLAPVEADVAERQLDQLLHAVGDAARDHVVVRLVLPEHQRHRAHVVAGVAPVATRVEVAEPELAREPERDRRRRVRDLPR